MVLVFSSSAGSDRFLLPARPCKWTPDSQLDEWYVYQSPSSGRLRVRLPTITQYGSEYRTSNFTSIDLSSQLCRTFDFTVSGFNVRLQNQAMLLG